MNVFELIKEKLEEYQENNTQNKSSDDYELGLFNACDYAIDVIDEVEQEYNNGWIACSERLPEKEDHYLVTKEDDIAYSIDIAIWNPHYHWSNNGFHKTDKVIAWQPLPAPYKEGGVDNGK